MSKNEIIKGIVKFKYEHGFLFHPGKTPDKWADLVIKSQGCPCVPGRPQCPCQEAADEVKNLGHCRCYLFCNESYMELWTRVVKRKREPLAH